MKGSIVALAAAASTVSAQGAAYSQCGGQGYEDPQALPTESKS